MLRGIQRKGPKVESSADTPSTLWDAMHWGLPLQAVQPVVNARLHTYACPEDEHDENSKSGKKTGGQTTFAVLFSNERQNWYVELRRYKGRKKIRKSRGGFRTYKEASEYLDEWLKTGVLDEVWN